MFAPETNPEHPVVVSASATTNKIKPQRFIVRLFRETFPRREVGWDEEEQLAGEQPLKFYNY